MQQAIEELQVDSGLKDRLREIIDHRLANDQRTEFLELNDIAPCQYAIITDFLDRWRMDIGKPRLFYDRDLEKLIIQWPSALHNALISGAIDPIVRQEVDYWTYPTDLVKIIANHNTELGGDHGKIIPNSCLKFSRVKGLAFDIDYPVICHVLSTEMFKFGCGHGDVMGVVDKAVNAVESCQMVVVLLVHESPSGSGAYAHPKPGSDAFMELVSKAQGRSETSGSAGGSTSTSGRTPYVSEDEFVGMAGLADKEEGEFNEPVVIRACGHDWCSVQELEIWVWLRDPFTGILNIRATSGDFVARGSLLSGNGMQEVNTMIGRGLEFVKNYLVWFCNTALSDSNTPTAFDLAPLMNHTPSIPDVTPLLLWSLHEGAQETAWCRFRNFLDSPTFQHAVKKRGHGVISDASGWQDEDAGPSDDRQRRRE